MGAAEGPSLGFFATMHVKEKALGNVFDGTFSDSSSDRISQRIHIVISSCSQLPSRSGIFCLLLKVVY